MSETRVMHLKGVDFVWLMDVDTDEEVINNNIASSITSLMYVALVDKQFNFNIEHRGQSIVGRWEGDRFVIHVSYLSQQANGV